jgi:hypothetical protein
MRFGFGPLYVRYVDIFDAVAVLEEILKTEWKMCRAGGGRSRLTKRNRAAVDLPGFRKAQSGLRCPQHSRRNAMSSLASKQGPRYRHTAGEEEPTRRSASRKLTPIIGAEISGVDLGCRCSNRRWTRSIARSPKTS